MSGSAEETGSSRANTELCSMPRCLREMAAGIMSTQQVKKEKIRALIQGTSTQKGEKARLKAVIHSVSVQLCFWLARH